METSKLLTELQQHGVTLTVDGDHLRYVAPKGALTDELRGAMKAHKAELLELLRTGATLPKAAATDWREVSERKRKAWRFEDSPEVKKRLAAGWWIVDECVCTNGTSYYSEPEGWVWKEGDPPPVSLILIVPESGGKN